MCVFWAVPIRKQPELASTVTGDVRGCFLVTANKRQIASCRRQPDYWWRGHVWPCTSVHPYISIKNIIVLLISWRIILRSSRTRLDVCLTLSLRLIRRMLSSLYKSSPLIFFSTFAWSPSLPLHLSSVFISPLSPPLFLFRCSSLSDSSMPSSPRLI